MLFDAFRFSEKFFLIKMSQTIKYVGKQTPHVGKTLWEILGNLDNFGVGRIIVRNLQQKKSEPSKPCYMKVLEVQAEPENHPEKYPRFRLPNDHRDKDVS